MPEENNHNSEHVQHCEASCGHKWSKMWNCAKDMQVPLMIITISCAIIALCSVIIVFNQMNIIGMMKRVFMRCFDRYTWW